MWLERRKKRDALKYLEQVKIINKKFLSYMYLWKKLDKMINNSQNALSAYCILVIFLYILYIIISSNTMVVQWVSLGFLDKIINKSILETKKIKVRIIRKLYF